MRARARTLLAILLSLPVSWAGAEPGYQSHASVIAAIERLIEAEYRPRGQDYQAEVLPLDPRLRLPECGQPLEAFFPQGSREAGSRSVGVRCAGERPWTVYARVRIQAFIEVVVLRAPLRRGGVVGPTDLALARKDLAELGGGYLTDPGQALGLAARRALPTGKVLSAGDLAAPKLVRRGQKVAIRAQSGGYEVSMSGEALADGQKGERIRVRNEQSGRIVEGVVAGPGLVLIRP
jgi:flagella basal body P-ring formation protein FlgA